MCSAFFTWDMQSLSAAIKLLAYIASRIRMMTINSMLYVLGSLFFIVCCKILRQRNCEIRNITTHVLPPPLSPKRCRKFLRSALPFMPPRRAGPGALGRSWRPSWSAWRSRRAPPPPASCSDTPPSGSRQRRRREQQRQERMPHKLCLPSLRKSTSETTSVTPLFTRRFLPCKIPDRDSI